MERERRKVLAGRFRQFVSGALRLVRFFEQSGHLQHPGELDEGLRLLEELLVVEATGDIRKVSLWLGHASIQSTEIYLRRGAFPISRSRAHTHRRHGHPLQTVPSAGLIERPQEKNRVDALR